MTKIHKFSQLAKLGKNDWWRYLLGFLIIFIALIYFGNIIYDLVVFFQFKYFANFSGDNLFSFSALELEQNSPKYFKELLEKVPNFLKIINDFIVFIPGFLAILFVVKFIHKRDYVTLFTTKAKINYSRFFHGSIVYLLFSLITYLLFFIIKFFVRGQIQGLELNFNLIDFLLSLIICLFLIPIQTSFEDLLFRGYFLQLLGLKIKSILNLTIITGLFFALPHLANPEIDAYGSIAFWTSYLPAGLFFAFVVLKDNRMELSLAIHFANNFLATLILGVKVSVFSSKPLLTINDYNPLLYFPIDITIYGLFYLYFFILPKHQVQGVRNQK
ncbi:MAG: lysostaphin resistance A-like protein [Xenococcaceae cyanobacterium]